MPQHTMVHFHQRKRISTHIIALGFEPSPLLWIEQAMLKRRRVNDKSMQYEGVKSDEKRSMHQFMQSKQHFN